MPSDKPKQRYIVSMIAGFVILFVGIAFTSDPLPQDSAYHRLADQRAWLQVPNFLNIVSNLPFAVIGLLGLSLCLKDKLHSILLSWSVFFAGLVLVAIGSSVYHWHPNNATLLWDRLPMTISFTSLFAALLTENVLLRQEKTLLPLALLIGVFSVLYWRFSNDLRFYAIVQYGTLLSIPIIVLLFKSSYSQRHYLLYGLLLYSLAKIFELNDRTLFTLSDQSISGHTLKHLLAATAAYCVYRMLKLRDCHQ